MKTKIVIHVRSLIRETRGAEIAEAAAVLPLMFMVLLGIFWFGQAFATYGAITRAAQEGARAGSFPYCATCGTTDTLPAFAGNAVAATNAALVASKLNPALVALPSPTPTVTTCLTSLLTAPTGCIAGGTNVCVLAPVQLTVQGTGATPVCGVEVAFGYPFQFWLPFASLNKQQIFLQASARVRLELR